MVLGMLANASSVEPIPKFSITPETSTTLKVPVTGVATVTYKVTNNTKLTRTLIPVLPDGVKQAINDTNPCSIPFTLAPTQFCLMKLLVNGNQLPQQGVLGGPEVCKTMGPGNNEPDRLLCSQPAQNSILNLTPIPVTSNLKVAVGYFLTLNPFSFNSLIYASQDGGTNWSMPIQADLPVGTTESALGGVSCDKSGLYCVAVGFTGNFILSNSAPLVNVSTDGGYNWKAGIQPGLPGGSLSARLSDVSCDASGQKCIAVGVSGQSASESPLIYKSINGGNQWQAPIVPTLPSGANTVLLSGVSCSSSGSSCVVVGTRDFGPEEGLPLAYTSNDSGLTWSQPILLTLPPKYNNVQLTGVSCSDSGLICTAMGFVRKQDPVTFRFIRIAAITYHSINGGISWQQPVELALPPGANSFVDSSVGVFCNSTGLNCAVVGGSSNQGVDWREVAYTSINGGQQWSAPILPPATSVINSTMTSINCDSTGILCTAMAVSDVPANPAKIYAYTSHDGGNTWDNPTDLIFSAPVGLIVFGLNGISGSK